MLVRFYDIQFKRIENPPDAPDLVPCDFSSISKIEIRPNKNKIFDQDIKTSVDGFSQDYFLLDGMKRRALVE